MGQQARNDANQLRHAHGAIAAAVRRIDTPLGDAAEQQLLMAGYGAANASNLDTLRLSQRAGETAYDFRQHRALDAIIETASRLGISASQHQESIGELARVASQLGERYALSNNPENQR